MVGNWRPRLPLVELHAQKLLLGQAQQAVCVQSGVSRRAASSIINKQGPRTQLSLLTIYQPQEIAFVLAIGADCQLDHRGQQVNREPAVVVVSLDFATANAQDGSFCDGIKGVVQQQHGEAHCARVVVGKATIHKPAVSQQQS